MERISKFISTKGENNTQNLTLKKLQEDYKRRGERHSRGWLLSAVMSFCSDEEFARSKFFPFQDFVN
jgi:hypothetical protein